LGAPASGERRQRLGTALAILNEVLKALGVRTHLLATNSRGLAAGKLGVLVASWLVDWQAGRPGGKRAEQQASRAASEPTGKRAASEPSGKRAARA